MARDTYRPNMTKLSRNYYLVRSEAGYRRAFKYWLKNVADWSDEPPRMLPKEYPAVVNFKTGTDIDYCPAAEDITFLFATIAPYIPEILGPKRPAPSRRSKK
jgi:hypothetical protein